MPSARATSFASLLNDHRYRIMEKRYADSSAPLSAVKAAVNHDVLNVRFLPQYSPDNFNFGAEVLNYNAPHYGDGSPYV